MRYLNVAKVVIQYPDRPIRLSQKIDMEIIKANERFCLVCLWLHIDYLKVDVGAQYDEVQMFFI